MSKRICTSQEIEQLHSFCKKHFVKYADVREELVDHLASAIEEQWENNANIHFGKALNKVYREFGVMGFRNVVSERQEVVRKSHFNLQKEYLLSFIKPPQVFVTLLIGVMLFYAIPQNPFLFRWGVGTSFAIALIFFIITYIYFSKRWKKQFKTKDILILNSATRMIAMIGGLPSSMISIINLSTHYDVIPLWLHIFTFVMLVVLIIATTFHFLLLKQAEKEVITKYPQLIKQ